MFSNKFLVVGGDLRNISLANHLIADGKRVKLFGFSKNFCQESYTSAPCFSNLQEALQNVEVVLGPMPCCGDNNMLNMPFHDSPLSIQSLFQSMTENQIFIAGFISEAVMQLAGKHNIPIFDVLKRNEMAILNAIPTVFHINIKGRRGWYNPRH